MRRFTPVQRRARLAIRHHLAPAERAENLVGVARDLVALHSTDPASVFLSLRARVRATDASTIERALYEDRSLVRFLGMRRTMFVVARDLLPVLEAACTRALVPGERRNFVRMLEEAGTARDGERWLIQAEEACITALANRGEATAAQLTQDVPALREQICVGKDKYARMQGVSTRVLFLLAAQGRIMRGRPRGSWTSSQYHWALAESWLSAPIAELDPESARVELVRRWLEAFGPATIADIRWWTGWTASHTKRALEEIAPVEVDLGGRPGIVLAHDLEPDAPPDPWVAMLPALDPTPMGWSERDWYLGEHRSALFDAFGNIGPTVWWEGRIVGGWPPAGAGEEGLDAVDASGLNARTVRWCSAFSRTSARSRSRRSRQKPPGSPRGSARPVSPPASARRWSVS